MGCGEEKTNLLLSSLAVQKKSKGNLFTEKPVFCDSGSSIIVSSGQSCHMYSVATGNHVRELFQCADDIISCQLHPFQPSLVIATTENGELSVFNIRTNETEYSIKLELNTKILKKHKTPKFSVELEEGDKNFDWEKQRLDSLKQRKFLYAEVKAFQNNPSEIFVWAAWCLSDESKSHLSVFTLNSGKHIKLFNIRNTGLRKCYMNFVLGSVQRWEVFVGMATTFLHCGRYDSQKRHLCKKHYIGHNIKLTCLAFHPQECCFATGDSLGRIIIWRNIFEKHPLRDLFHWHALPVHDLYFSKFGNYLFSGGEENVLVKWSLSSHNKEFLPRLSSAIHHISGMSESSLLSLSTLDNKILIVNFNFEKISIVQHFSRWSLLKGKKKFDIFTVDPRSNCFVLSGKTGHIQFLSLNEDGKFVYTFDVTNRNFITSDNNCFIVNTEVTHAKFSKSGKWLITAESRKEGTYKESRLKFWMYCDKESSFTLNTNVEFPHEEFGIYSLEISADDMVATTGGDKKFRLWTPFEYQRINEMVEIWFAQSAGKYRNLPCYAIDFSKDASLIAVSFGPVLTVWETSTCDFKCTLSVPSRKDQLRFCKFGNNELSHLVVCGSDFFISSWNTITLSVIWTVPIRLSILISDPFSIYMIAFSNDRDLIIFNPSSPTPDLILKKVCDHSVVAAHCVPNEASKFCLYFVTEKQDLYCLADAEKVAPGFSKNRGNSFLTPFSAQLAEIQSRPVFEKGKTVVSKNSHQFVSTLLDSPAHTLPNPSLLCSDILKGLLIFSNSLSSGASAKDLKNENSGDVQKLIENGLNADCLKMEVKLLDVVKSFFV